MTKLTEDDKLLAREHAQQLLIAARDVVNALRVFERADSIKKREAALVLVVRECRAVNDTLSRYNLHAD